MTIHKLSVGDGYTYLTRQVAGADVPRRGDQSAADYYTQGGNPPGRWMGSGLATLGLAEGSPVGEEQMRHLFGLGIHPDAERRYKDFLAAHLRSDMTDAQAQRVHAQARATVKLGQKFPEYQTLEPFATRVARRLAAIATETGRAATSAETAKVKREEAARQRTSVAGYDLVFTPVKSVSLLWALHSDANVRGQVRTAHDAAVAAVIDLLQEHAAFTRAGVGGVAQIETKGLIAAAFDHFDSRAGDPDLHTHVAIANKVQGADGKWRSLDGTALYALGVAASETYNSTVEAELSARLGIVFTDRPGPARNARPVREIAGVDPELVTYFSSRRTAISARYAELRAAYRAEHGREPDAKVLYELAQRATLETRGAKDTPRSLERMRTDWIGQVKRRFAGRVLADLTASVRTDLAPVAGLTPVQVAELGAAVVRTIAEERATWTRWNLHAETMRQLRSGFVFTTPGTMREAADQVVDAALGRGNSIRITVPPPVEEPALLRRSDGVSVFCKHEGDRYTTRAILDAETQLLEAAEKPTVFAAGREAMQARLDAFERTSGRVLDAGQRRLVTAFATDDRLLAVGIGPAGSGKTTAMRAFREVLAADRRRLIGLAPTAKAAKVLAADLGVRCDTVDKFLWEISPGNRHSGPELADLLRARHATGATAAAPTAARRGRRGQSPIAQGLRPGDVLLVDEASMAGTLNLDRVVAVASYYGAQVRLLGDTHQLGAVASGGAMRLIANKVGATELTELHRFTDPAFAEASLKLRAGDSAGLDYFEARGRLFGGTEAAMIDALYTAWRADVRTGKTSIMLAQTNATVAALSARARADRVTAGEVRADGVQVADGNIAAKGDWVVTRSNDARLRYCRGKDHVRNGEVWTVVRTYRGGAMKVKAHDSKATTVLPANYVKEHVELAYAATVNRSQGMTVDTVHPLLTAAMDRTAFYVLATRAAEVTSLYAVTHQAMPPDPDDRTWRPGWDPDATAAREIAEQILANEPDDIAATEAVEQATTQAESLASTVDRYRFAADLAAVNHYRALAEQTLKPALSQQQWAEFLETGQGPLARALAAAETTGWDAKQLLALAARRSFDDAASPAAVVVARLQHLTENHPAPPPGERPEPRDVAYYAKLLRDHHPRLKLDPQAALRPPATDMPATDHSPVAAPSADRYRTELAQVLGDTTAAAIATERAWPTLVGALARAEATGQYSLQALGRALAQRDLDGVESCSEILAWRLDRQTRLIAHDPTHSGQAWPALAWTLKAWETRTGRDAAYLIDELAPGRGLNNLAIAVGDTVAKHAQHERRQADPTGLPWISYPVHVLESGANEQPLRDYLAALGTAIRERADNLAESVLLDRPEWTRAFGPEPADPAEREALQAAIRIAAAYRDQHRIDDNDSSHPFGPYPETGRAGHREWWAAAAAITAHQRVSKTSDAPDLGRSVEQELASSIAHDIYRSLPETERSRIHTSIISALDSVTAAAFNQDPETTVCHRANTGALLTTLAHTGHLTPSTAAGLGLTKPHMDESRQRIVGAADTSVPRIEIDHFTFEPVQSEFNATPSAPARHVPQP